jgi:hypothetical protein
MEQTIAHSFTVGIDLTRGSLFNRLIQLPPEAQEGIWAYYLSRFNMGLCYYDGNLTDPWTTIPRIADNGFSVLPFGFLSVSVNSPTKIYSGDGKSSNVLSFSIYPTVESESSPTDITMSYNLEEVEQPELCLLSGDQTLNLSVNSGRTNTPLQAIAAIPGSDPMTVFADNTGTKWWVTYATLTLSFVRLR